MARIRTDVRKLNQGWDPVLEWYAKAIADLSGRAPNDRTSWAYIGAIHGEDLQGWVQDGIVAAGGPFPSQSEQDRIWNQCQHASWYFLPWHRGYLHSFESIIAKTVEDLGGPSDWALPYWNYLDTSEPAARDMPAAFTDKHMPDGSPNPLSKPYRASTTLGPQPWLMRDIDLSAIGEPRFTAAAGALGFGGGATLFNHSSGPTGALESNPHNRVHVMIGGLGPVPGYMSDPNYAALDPIFWLHHCNIDRLWSAWMTKATSIQENRPQWMQGPAPRQFELPDEHGNLVVFTPSQGMPGGSIEPTYDDLSQGTGVPGATIGGQAMPAAASTPPPAALPMGSNNAPVDVTTASTTLVRLAPSEAIPATPMPERVFLNLENVTGTAPSAVLNVFLSLPESGAVPATVPELADTVTLFGLANASRDDNHHAGNGLTVVLDITDLVRSLRTNAGSDLDRLQVRFEQPQGAEKQAVTVGRVSVYRQTVE